MTRPGAGPSRARTSARTSALVIIESRCSNASSGSAQPSGAPWWPASQRGVLSASAGPSGPAGPTGLCWSSGRWGLGRWRRASGSRAMRMFGSAKSLVGSAGSAARSVIRSCAVPRHSATYTRLPAASSSAPRSRAEAVRGAVRMAALGCARAAASACLGLLGSRPWAEITRASSQSRPSRAKARVTEEVAGMTLGSIFRARSARTMPKNPGSPEASTAAGPERTLTASRASSRCLSSLRSAPGGIGAFSRCLGAPMTSVAAARACDASGPRGRPSQPITVTSGLMPPPRRSWSGR